MSFRLVSYRVGAEVRAGVVIDERVHDAARLSGRTAWATMRGVLAEWALAERTFSTARADGGTPLAEAQLVAPIFEPGDLFCAGANYDDHIAEMFRMMNQPLGPNMKQLGDIPWHFVKTGRSSVVGPDAVVTRPRYTKALDWELELAAVIGRVAKDIPVEHALEHVAGYTIANDLSARDVITRDKAPPTSPFRYDWISIKCFDGSCPLGPWIVPARDVPDPQHLALKLWVNDELMQDSSTTSMIFSVAEQIAHLSSRVTLQPGDLILTGTPAGVGMGRGRFLQPGDVVKLWIERIGTLTHGVS